MSGLKLVPRIPKRPSTMKGSEAPARAANATTAPSRIGSPPSLTLPSRKASDATVATSTAIAEIVPSPGNRTVPQHNVVTKARPVAGASHDQRRHPQSASAAWPIASDAAQTAITDI
jgi:hypothetical protein